MINEISEISVDSLKLRLPLNPELVQLNPKAGLNDEYEIYNKTTGEVKVHYPKSKKTPLVIDGIEYLIYPEIKKIRGITDRYLIICVHSHQLKERYFEGLTLQNIEDIYKNILALDIFHCTLDTFLNRSYCTDIDFKEDFLTDNTYYKYMNMIFRQYTHAKKQNMGYNTHQENTSWNSRGATPTKPHVKLYDKHKQLNQKCAEFKEKFLQGQDLINIRRLEFNIKDQKHLTRTGIGETQTSLHHILSLTQDQMQQMKRKVLSYIMDIDGLLGLEAPKAITKELKPLKGESLVTRSTIINAIAKDRTYRQTLEVVAQVIGETRANKAFINKWLKLYSHFKEFYIEEKPKENRMRDILLGYHARQPKSVQINTH